MPLGLILGLGRAFRRKRTSSLDILSSKRAPRDYYKGKNCKPTGFHTRKAKYVVQQEKLPNYVVPDLTDFKADTCDGRIGPCQRGGHKSSPKEWMQLKPYVSQCPREVKNTQSAEPTK